MSQWTREELVEAFETFQEAGRHAAATGDWEPWVQCFTPDASYVEHAYGRFSGHDEIRTWVNRTMTSFPGNEMTGYPMLWFTVDVEKGWIITEVDNPMRDPGDGSVHSMTNLTILRYGGGGKWREEEDVYNPMEFFEMAKGFVRRSHELGTLSADGRAWAEKFGITL